MRNNRNSRENVITGAIGAIIFALIGGVAMILLWNVRRAAILSGLIALFCAMKGYKVFGRGGRSIKGIIISIIASIIVLVAAWHFGLILETYKFFREKFLAGDIGFSVPFSLVFENPYLLLQDVGDVIDYGIDLVFAVGVAIMVGVILVIYGKKGNTAKVSSNMPNNGGDAFGSDFDVAVSRLNGEEVPKGK